MNIINEAFSWIATILIAFIIGSAINIFIFQPTKVDGKSMYPTLEDQDTVIVSKVFHTFNIMPEYGDIVIIDSRVNEKRDIRNDLLDNFQANVLVSMFKKQTEAIFWIKRVIGKPGDEIEFRDGKCYVNGSMLNEPYINEPIMEFRAQGKLVVPKSNVFVMGDNRNHSYDSRYIGPVPLSHVIGKYVCRVEFMKKSSNKDEGK